MFEPRQPVTDHAIRLWRTMALITAIRSLIALDAFAHLINPCTVELLASATAASPDVLRRLLRVVVEHGIVRFRSLDQTYWNTRVSSAYQKGSDSSKFVQMMYDFSLAVDISGWVSTRDTRDRKRQTSHTHNPFTFTFGCEGTPVWKVLGKQPDKLETLHNGLETMQTLHPFSSHTYQLCLTKTISLGDKRCHIVDVGGGNGHFLAVLLLAHPNIEPKRAVLQDLQSALEYAKRNPDLPRGVIQMEHDFFSPQPVVSAYVYHIRACLHNWGDQECVRILNHLRVAMNFDSKLLVAENVVSKNPLQGETVGAMDLLMLGIGGRERTLHEFLVIFKQAGLQLDAVWPTGTGHWTVLQASKCR